VSQTLKFEGLAAAVTGAASGIGRALSLELAALGCDVAIADVDVPGLEALAEEIRRTHSRRVLLQRVDVADLGQVQAFAREAISAFPALSIMVNNAGVALRGDFDEIDLSQMQWLMGINFWGVVHGTRSFLPHLESQPRAHIVNLSSIFGVVAPPGQCAYAAAKFAVRGFSEALRHELAAKKSPVRLTVVLPGGVATNIARNAAPGPRLKVTMSAQEAGRRFAQIARTTPQAAARRIVRGIERSEARVLIGSDARLMELIQRFRPVSYWAMMARGLQRMSESRGPGT
jgi:short-subunit dehydrogenase